MHARYDVGGGWGILLDGYQRISQKSDR
jgi:hypothetical protein